MEVIKILIKGADAETVQAPVVTTGMVGCVAEFSFDSSWDGLSRSALFRAGGICKMQAAIEDTATVPTEVLQMTGHMLQIGVFGVSADGSVVIPTVWSDVDFIQEGTDNNAEAAAEPELPVWQQVLAKLDAVIADKLNILPGECVVMSSDMPEYGPVLWYNTGDEGMGALIYIDALNQQHVLMPKTDAENVQGLTQAVERILTLTKLLATGPMVLSPHQYGDTLPDPGIPGRIFFKKVGS